MGPVVPRHGRLPVFLVIIPQLTWIEIITWIRKKQEFNHFSSGSVWDRNGSHSKARTFQFNCAQKYRKLSKTIEKYRKGSKTEKLQKVFVYRGNPLFSALSLRTLPPTHGRSHRFKSCIAHSFVINDLRNPATRQNDRCAQNSAHFQDLAEAIHYWTMNRHY
jgi:hypothetical protein